MALGAQGYNRNPGGRKGVCFQCEKRQPGCHAKCEDYLKERGDWEEHIKKRMQEATIDNYQADRAFKLSKKSGKKSFCYKTKGD